MDLMNLNFILRGLESSQEVMLSSRTFPKYFVTPFSQPRPLLVSLRRGQSGFSYRWLF